VEIWASSASNSPFVPGFEVGPTGEDFMPNSQSGIQELIAAHQDFLSLVSTASPARPGEYIHFYATDLGPVIPAPPVGLPAPLNPLSILAVPISCTLGVYGDRSPVPVNVFFAGLAPGLLNVFQLDVQMPGSFHGSPSVLNCLTGYPSVGYQISGNLPVQ
jgi:uncharacterized protein (TIGR03437 family)